MTLVEYELEGRFRGFCYEKIVEQLDLQEKFQEATGETIEEYSFDPMKITEDELIHKILEVADQEYILYSDVVGRRGEMYYGILRLD